jgi:error-prone DNA polymerase
MIGPQLRPEITEPAVSLPVMTMGREVVEDYRSKGLSLRAHPVAFLRESPAQRGFAPCSSLRDAPNARRISIAGLILVRRMPGPAKGGHVHRLGRRRRQREYHRLALRL